MVLDLDRLKTKVHRLKLLGREILELFRLGIEEIFTISIQQYYEKTPKYFLLRILVVLMNKK